MNKSFLVIPLFVMLALTSAGSALAAVAEPSYTPFWDSSWDTSKFRITTMTTDGSAQTDNYAVDSTALLQVYVPDLSGNVTVVNTFWNDNTNQLYLETKNSNPQTADSNSIPGQYFWITGPTFTASDIGNWSVNGAYTSIVYPSATTKFDFQNQSMSLNYKVVTPEPVAMLLYGVGGIPLAFAFLKRRKESDNS